MATGILHEELRPLDHNMASAIASDLQLNSKRQRRPSVRLGEIGDEPMPLVLQKLFKRKKTQPNPENAVHGSRHYTHQRTDQVGGEADLLMASIVRSKGPRVRALKQVAPVLEDENHVEHMNGNELLEIGGFQEHLDAEGAQQTFASTQLRRVHVGLKKRTKRGKLAKRKRIIANKSLAAEASPAAQFVQAQAVGKSPSSAVNDVSDTRVGAHFGGGNLEALQTEIHEPEHSENEPKESQDIDSLWKENDDGDQVKQCEENEKVSAEEQEYLKALEVDEPKHEYSIQVAATGAVTNLEVARETTVTSRCDSDRMTAEHDNKLIRDKEELACPVDQKDSALVCDVRTWLEALNLGRYSHLFELHEVDRDVLPLLTIEDLREMGIAAVGTRRKMFAAIQALSHKDSNVD